MNDERELRMDSEDLTAQGDIAIAADNVSDMDAAQPGSGLQSPLTSFHLNLQEGSYDEGEGEILVDDFITTPKATKTSSNYNTKHAEAKSFHSLYKLYSQELPPNNNGESERPTRALAAPSDSLSATVLSDTESPGKDKGDELPLPKASTSTKNNDELIPRPATHSEHSSTLLHGGEGEDGPPKTLTLHQKLIRQMHKRVLNALLVIAGVAVRFPRITLVSLSLLSLGLISSGWYTNFYIETDSAELWPPSSSLSLEHAFWTWQDSHFNYNPVTIDIIIHKNGKSNDVLGQEGVDRVFEVQEIFTNDDQYKEGCALAEQFGDLLEVGQCWIHSVADFWNQSYSLFESTVENDQDAITALSQSVYPNGILVDVDTVMGKTERSSNDMLSSVLSYSIKFGIPWSNSTLNFEAKALDRLLLLRNEWEARGDDFQMEIRSYSSFSNEFLRSIQSDLWLLPLTCGIVTLFTIFFAFGKWDKVKSQGLLGIGAVLTIVASIMTSFGILFCIGVPFTTQTLMVPFLMFGIGLDDAFIIYGSYSRRSHWTDINERIRSTMEDVGVSIFLTSLTSMLAFILGSFSNIPAVSWLCLYAFPCIGVDFLYQITFFVALVVLDERRIQEGRMDYCTCITVETPSQTNEDQSLNDHGDDHAIVPLTMQQETHPADRLMSWWATQLLKPGVHLVSLVAFLAILGSSIYCTTQLHQEFDFVAMVPQDSYLKDFYSALDMYTTRDGVYGYVYFRDVDQSDPTVQKQMLYYINDLVGGGQVDEPIHIWLKDFQKFSAQQSSNSSFFNKPFQEQVDAFLSVGIYHELYDEAISRTVDGKVMETRVEIHISFDIQDSKAATDMLSNMREISASQPINQDTQEWKFFTYASAYHLYEFYNRVVEELIFTSVMSIVAVSIIAMFFIPHWSAVLFVFPFISFLYINMLGYLYLSGVQINAISYVTLVMSIGLMIDYIMHILMRYYDCQGTRQERVQETMSSIGASIFLGAASTFLGVLCLSLSTSDILQDIFLAVVGLITFGVLNGLIFLPIALVWFGPEENQADLSEQREQSNGIEPEKKPADDHSLANNTHPTSPPSPAVNTTPLSRLSSALSDDSEDDIYSV